MQIDSAAAPRLATPAAPLAAVDTKGAASTGHTSSPSLPYNPATAHLLQGRGHWGDPPVGADLGGGDEHHRIDPGNDGGDERHRIGPGNSGGDERHRIDPDSSGGDERHRIDLGNGDDDNHAILPNPPGGDSRLPEGFAPLPQPSPCAEA